MSDETPAGKVSSMAAGSEEPEGWGLALLPNARQRVRATYGLLGLLFFVMLGWGLFLRFSEGTSWHPPAGKIPPMKPATIAAGGLIGLAASITAYLAGRGSSTKLATRVALVALPFACLGIDLVTMPGSRFVHFSWAGLLIVSFPFMVPTDRKSLIVSTLFAAAAIPLGLVIGRTLIADGPTPAGAVRGAVVTSTIFVILAVISHRVIRNVIDASRDVTGYRLDPEPLGEGGMGEVYKAYRPLLKTPVAIKLIHLERLAGKEPAVAYENQSRLMQEAEIAAQLQSPHTARVYDLGLSASGDLFIVMEYLVGKPFDHLIGAPLTDAQVASWIRQACHSLAEAHDRGIFHRDIKPGNLMLCEYAGEENFVKVLDFGLGLLVHDDAFRHVLHDKPMGTHRWAAPELWLGETPGPRADLYSLGCVLFVLLTGALPFDGKEEHLAATRPDPREYRSDLPTGLAELISECIALDPGDRPGSARELGERLAAWT